MKRLLLSIVVLSLWIGGTLAQGVPDERELTEAEKKILAYEACFERQFSKPETHDASYKIGGRRVPVVEMTRYATRQFVQADPLLDNVKLMLMDNKDLPQWVRLNARAICESYFADGQPGFHIAAHGLQEDGDGSADKIKMGGEDLTAEETADLIMQTLNDYEICMNVKRQPFPVVLHTCGSAKGGDNSFAAKLSAILSKRIDNVAVIAASNDVICRMEGNRYSEYVEGSMRGRHGNWLVFKNGQQAMEGTSDYKSTVKNYLDSK